MEGKLYLQAESLHISGKREAMDMVDTSAVFSHPTEHGRAMKHVGFSLGCRDTPEMDLWFS